MRIAKTTDLFGKGGRHLIEGFHQRVSGLNALTDIGLGHLLSFCVIGFEKLFDLGDLLERLIVVFMLEHFPKFLQILPKQVRRCFRFGITCRVVGGTDVGEILLNLNRGKTHFLSHQGKGEAFLFNMGDLTDDRTEIYPEDHHRHGDGRHNDQKPERKPRTDFHVSHEHTSPLSYVS